MPAVTKKSKKKKPEAKDSEVMAKLRAERAKKRKKTSASAKVSTGRKGAERPADDEATEDRERQLVEKSRAAKSKTDEAHFAATPLRRMVGHARARGRKADQPG